MGNDIIENFWTNEGYKKPDVETMPKHWLQQTIWELMEFPDSSILARILAFISLSVIIMYKSFNKFYKRFN